MGARGAELLGSPQGRTVLVLGFCQHRVIASVPPSMTAYQKLSITTIYFPNLFRESMFISHRNNLLISSVFKPKILWGACHPHAYLAGGEFEIREVN